jgi:YrbI family 3-deoxy-D-manno-octulosonate 8-phosphate phosphatase
LIRFIAATPDAGLESSLPSFPGKQYAASEIQSGLSSDQDQENNWMNTLAIIPARGGSKGIPRKNVRLLAAKPLVAYAIENARQSRTVNRVVVSTDDPEIAAVSTDFGAEVVWRPAEISGDTASSESALLHTLECLRETESYVPELVVFLQCTSPLTLPEDIDGTVQALLDERADCALAVTPFHYFLWRQDQQEGGVGINHDKRIRPRRQDREAQFLETGAVYVMRTEGFLQAKHRFFGKTAMYVMPQERCLEIDEPVDFLLAEVLLRERQQQDRRERLPNPVSALVMDFDGVFTDNKVIVFQDGQEAVVCDRSDGWGLSHLRNLGLPVLVISTEKNPVVRARCDKLGITCLYGVDDKLAALNAWLKECRIDQSKVIYVGNDVNDLSCLRAVGCAVVVNDAHPEVRAAAHVVLSAPGGNGAIRELVDLIVQRLETQKDAKGH